MAVYRVTGFNDYAFAWVEAMSEYDAKRIIKERIETVMAAYPDREWETWGTDVTTYNVHHVFSDYEFIDLLPEPTDDLDDDNLVTWTESPYGKSGNAGKGYEHG